MSGYCPDCGNTLCICTDITVDKIRMLFKADGSTEKQIQKWLHTENVEMGGAKPITLIIRGRGSKVINYVEALLNGY
jgi:hypothetical protein